MSGTGQPSGGKIRAGQPFRGINAADWNSFLDAAAWIKQNETVNKKPTINTHKRRTGIVKVKNGSGADRSRFDIVGFDNAGYIFDPGDDSQLDGFKAEVSLIGVEPTCDHLGKFGVLVEAITSATPGNIGDAVVSGLVQCRIEVCDSDHEFADVLDGDSTRLISVQNPAGAQIIAKEGGTGERWAIVRLSNRPEAGVCVSTCTTDTTETTGTPTTATQTTATTTTRTTTTETTTTRTTTTCDQSFDCSAYCHVTLEVVTDVECSELGIAVTKTTICLPARHVGAVGG